MITRNPRWILGLALGSLLSQSYVADAQETERSLEGQFQCRDWESQPTTLLAVLVLHRDGAYEATDRLDDLKANRPTTTGRYTYEKAKQQIVWTSGEWRNRVALYMPRVKGTDFVVIHTTRDPEGKVDGTLRCARTLPPQ
jgi:hypothetical protein